MSDVVLRPATGHDLAALIAEPLPYRVRAFAAFLCDAPRTPLDDASEGRNDELLGVGGLAFLPDGTVAAFLLLARPEARRYRVALHKAALRTLDEARRLGIRRVVALAEPGVEPAARWLERLGFRETAVGGEKAYVWVR